MQNQTHVVGADPEVFLVNEQDQYISSIDRIGGSKHVPRPIDEEGCAVQEDNVAVEYNIPPCSTVDQFVHYNRKVLANLAEHVSKQGLRLKIIPSAVFDKSELRDPRAKEFGCEPDFNAWRGGEQNPRPRAKNKQLRSAGGHIHIGSIDGLDILYVVRAMDLFVGVGMMKYDTDQDRRQLYGKAGAHRPKPYGVEYRAASNAWLQSDETIRYVWQQTARAVEFVRSGAAHDALADDTELSAKIQKCINESDMALYEELSKEFGL